MKNLIGIIVLLFVFSCTSNQPKDNRLLFSVKIKPDQKYSIETKNSFRTEIRYDGKEKAMNKLRSMGVKNPNVVSRGSQLVMVLTTEKRLDNHIPVRLEIVKSTGLGDQPEICQGISVNGESVGGNMPGFSSVASVKSSGLDEKALLQSISNNFSRLTLPEKRLNIGEEFTVESSLAIPMEKSHVEIAVSTIYKLVSVANGLANFDVTQKYEMSQLRKDNSFSGTGGGSGKLVYSPENEMVTSFEIKSNLEMNKKLENFLFILKTQSEFVQKIEVTKK